MTGTAVHLTDAPVGSDEWAEVRRARVNGSEIAAIMGISPYESPFSSWHRKAGHIGEVEPNQAMYWGTQLEPVIRGEWNRRHPDLPVAETGQWCHHTRTWQGGSPDGVVPGRPLLWEAKTARFADNWGEPGTDAVPVWYRAQALWYLDVFGYDTCHFSVLIAGSDYREYAVHYNPAEAALMREAALDFLDALDCGRRPDIDESTATYQVVRQLNPYIDGTTVEIDADTARAYSVACAATDYWRASKQRATSHLLDLMGTARYATHDGHRVAMRVPGRDDNPPFLRPCKPTSSRGEAA